MGRVHTQVPELCRSLMLSPFMSDKTVGLARFLQSDAPDRLEVLAQAKTSWSRWGATASPATHGLGSRCTLAIAAPRLL